MEKKEEMSDTYLLLVGLFCCAVLVSSVWKNCLKVTKRPLNGDK